MNISDTLLQKLMEMEGCRLSAYRDEGGVPTIGYGHTRGVRMGDRISPQQARDWLLQDATEVMRQVRRQWEAERFFAPSYPTDDEIIDRV